MAIDWRELFKKSHDSLKGYIRPTEFIKVILQAFTAGGSIYAILEFIGNHLNEFVIDPVDLLNLQQFISHANAKNWTALFFAGLTLIISAYNKFNRGTVILNPSAIPTSKAVIVESVVDKSVAEKVAEGIPVTPKSL